ncbi:hypothetical protein [Streptomyces malaysiensis]
MTANHRAEDPVQLVLVNHLAEMLLDDKPSDVRERAYSIAYELQQAGLDLGAAIADRTRQLNPWAPPVRATEPPF